MMGKDSELQALQQEYVGQEVSKRFPGEGLPLRCIDLRARDLPARPNNPNWSSLDLPHRTWQQEVQGQGHGGGED
jgi:hypothetical protein